MFISNSQKDKEEMLKTIGVSSVKELIAQIPAGLHAGKLDLPPALNEQELHSHIAHLGSKNRRLVNFAGAGAYDHFIPSAVKYLASKGEFVTAYTPYQAEASQGTLQAIFEYQASVCALFDMDVSNASLYDGASALAEAVNASMRATSRTKVILPQALHPHYRETLETYFRPNPAVKFETVQCPGGVMDIAALSGAVDDATACVVMASPNYYGCLENAPEISRIAHGKKAMLVALVNPLGLGVLASPGSYGADFAVAEGQCLGNPLNYGGPYLGIFTCRQEHIRHVPGRICGVTKDVNGKRAFVLTLQAREQHIRREKAASNICSNEALCALYATIYMALLGPEGLKEVAELNIERAHAAAQKLSAVPGFSLKYDKPFYNEFVLKCPCDAKALRDKLVSEGILAGVPVGKDLLLVCVTEMRSMAEIDALAAAMRRNSNV